MNIIVKSKTSIDTWTYHNVTTLSYNPSTKEITFTHGNGASKTVKLSDNWIIIEEI